MAGLYVHIPFCHSKCAYCDFYSTPSLASVDDVADAIVREYGLRRNSLDFSTIYFGGGTPSILPLPTLRRIVDALPHSGVAEQTLEANPEDVTAERAAAWRQMGFGRVSMGVQSLVDSELQVIGRRHTGADAAEAVATLRQAGIDNISLDLIYGLPGQTLRTWEQSLDGVLAMRPSHLSAYILSYEPGTRLTMMLRRGQVAEASEQTIADMYAMLIDKTRAHGYEHYEISNFALPGMRARHNSAYWTGEPYLGLGPAAHSFDGRQRTYNPQSVKAYLDAIRAGTTACVVDEEDDANRFNDMVMVGLRTSQGVDTRRLERERVPRLMRDAEPLLRRGLLVADGPMLVIPEEHWLVSDAIICDLLQ